MLVCAPPRCGATKYCLDLEQSTGLTFVGELTPMYIADYGAENRKAAHHETLFQPDMTKAQFVSYLTDRDKYIVLCNQAPHLLVHSSDVVVLRKSLEDNLFSVANFFIKAMPYLTAEGIIQYLHLAYQSIYGLLTYLEVNDKPIIWYEDYFNISGTKTNFLDEHKHSRIIKRTIHSLLKSNDAVEIVETIYAAKTRS